MIDSGGCPTGDLSCDGGCVQDGVQNCGGCGQACAAGGTNGVKTNGAGCTGTTCLYTCQTGYLDCNASVGYDPDGCECNVTAATNTSSCCGTAVVSASRLVVWSASALAIVSDIGGSVGIVCIQGLRSRWQAHRHPP